LPALRLCSSIPAWSSAASDWSARSSAASNTGCDTRRMRQLSKRSAPRRGRSPPHPKPIGSGPARARPRNPYAQPDRKNENCAEEEIAPDRIDRVPAEINDPADKALDAPPYVPWIEAQHM